MARCVKLFQSFIVRCKTQNTPDLFGIWSNGNRVRWWTQKLEYVKVNWAELLKIPYDYESDCPNNIYQQFDKNVMSDKRNTN